MTRFGFMVARILQLAALLGSWVGGELQAQGLAVGAGRLHEVSQPTFTYVWRADYYQFLSPHLSVSFGWLNEGHLPGNHRDGAVAQVWTIQDLKIPHLRLGVGLGIYQSFDTRLHEGGYRNEHDTRPLASVSLIHPIRGGPWETLIQVNRTLGGPSPITQSVLLGMAYRLGPVAAPTSRPRAIHGEGEQEILLFYGQTTLNSDVSESSEAYQLSYRRRLPAPHWAWSLSYVNEGTPERLRRDGLNAQLWLEGLFLERRLRLELGLGPYVTRVERYDGPADLGEVHVSMRSSLAVGWRLAPNWSTHLYWNRTRTSYHRDTDMLVAGLGFDW